MNLNQTSLKSLFIVLIFCQFSLAFAKSNFSFRTLSQQELTALAEQIANNEFTKREDVVFWSRWEKFPSLGILHAIWPNKKLNEGFEVVFDEMMKDLVLDPHLSAADKIANDRILQRILMCPNSNGCKGNLTAEGVRNYFRSSQWSRFKGSRKVFYKKSPWRSRDEFLRDEKGRKALENFYLDHNIKLAQAKFAFKRMTQKVSEVFDQLQNNNESLFIYNPKTEMLSYKKRIDQQVFGTIFDFFKELISTSEGLFCIVDYINFKGTGLKPVKGSTSKENPWGLKQVLKEAWYRDSIGIHKDPQQIFYLSAYQTLVDRARCVNSRPTQDDPEQKVTYNDLGCKKRNGTVDDIKKKEPLRGFENRVLKSCLPQYKSRFLKKVQIKNRKGKQILVEEGPLYRGYVGYGKFRIPYDVNFESLK